MLPAPVKAYVADESKGCWRSPDRACGAGWAGAELLPGAVVGVAVVVVVLVVAAVVGMVDGVVSTRTLSPAAPCWTVGVDPVCVTSLAGRVGEVVAVLVDVDGAVGRTPVVLRFLDAATCRPRLPWSFG